MNYYTPGPWHQVLHDNRIEIFAETRDEIARIDLDDTDEDALAETETNARLIAAAPDLLTVCLEVLRISAIPRVSSAAVALEKLVPKLEGVINKINGERSDGTHDSPAQT